MSTRRPRTYFTHDNGDRPYKVVVSDERALVFKRARSAQPDYEFKGHVMVGRSRENEMTRWSGAFGPEYDGNSVLVYNGVVATFIGHRILRFRPLAAIHVFASPVGNNDAPYPYAIDTRGNYYLIIANVVVASASITNHDDPYSHQGGFYDIHKMRGFEDIDKSVTAGQAYDVNWGDPESWFKDENGEPTEDVNIRNLDGSTRRVNRAEVKALMDRFAAARGFSALQFI